MSFLVIMEIIDNEVGLQQMINNIWQSSGFRRIVIFAGMIFVLYLLRDMLNLILLTFIFTFLMDQLVKLVSKWVPINRKLLVVILYAVIIGLLSWAIVNYLPMVIKEIKALIRQLSAFYTAKH